MNAGTAATTAVESATPALPWSALLALATAGFVTILTEALPAALLASISRDLQISAGLAGQWVTSYAIGSLVCAIPLVALTRGWRRRPLLLWALSGFVIANTVSACSHNYVLSLVARFIGGVGAGLLWALLAGYASRLAAPSQRGRAIAVAMLGTPVALSVGIPAGSVLGQAIGWRGTFGVISALSLLVLGWVRWKVADFPGESATARSSFGQVLRLPGIRPVLLTTLGFVLAHNLLYTYIAPLLAAAGLAQRLDAMLLLFGVMALLGIAIAGWRVDRWLRRLSLLSIAIFALACLALGLPHLSLGLAAVAIGLWGLAFGGAATLFQTASANAAGASADLAQSMIVTAWNLAIAGGGLLGGILLSGFGPPLLGWVALVLLLACGWIVHAAHRHGFRPSQPGPATLRPGIDTGD